MCFVGGIVLMPGETRLWLVSWESSGAQIWILWREGKEPWDDKAIVEASVWAMGHFPFAVRKGSYGDVLELKEIEISLEKTMVLEQEGRPVQGRDVSDMRSAVF